MTAAVVLTTACNSEDGTDKDKEPEIGPDKITMTTQLSNVSIYIEVVGTVTIDWGDKTEIESYTFPSALTFTHDYSDFNSHTITISGDNITYFMCHNQGLLQLDVSKNPNLTVLRCGMNQLSSLDVSNNTALKELECYMNELKELDISKNTKLEYLHCQTNQITNLDLRNNIALRHLRFPRNQLTSSAINATFRTLNDTIIEGSTKILYCSGNPGTYNCDRSIAENKGWSIMDVP